MNAKWRQLAGELLIEVSKEFANHGCNDFTWPDTWTPEERHHLVLAMMIDNGHVDDDIYTGQFGPPDWWVMCFLGKQLQAQAIIELFENKGD